MTPLGADKLRKSPAYADDFVKRLHDKKAFSIVKGTSVVGKVVLLEAPGVDRVLKTGSIQQLKDLRFTDGKGHIYSLNQIGRDKDFGGSDIKTVMQQESSDIKRMRVVFSRLRAAADTDALELQTKSGHVVELCGVRAPSKTTSGKLPKADVVMVGEKAKPVMFVSLKKGGGPSNFGQWSGVTKDAGTRIADHPEVQKFVKDVLSLYPDKIIPRATTVQRVVKDRTLAMLAVYGPDFGGLRGTNNVDVVLVGTPKFEKIGKEYQIKGETTTFYNGDPMHGQYEVTLQAAYKGENRNDFGIRGARFTLSPIGGRNSIMI